MGQPTSTPEDIFSFAVALERTLRGLYGSTSQDIREPDVKEALRQLADDELGHEKLLRSHFASLGVCSPPAEEILFSIFRKGRETAHWATSPTEALRIALALEIRGGKFYSRWAERTSDRDARGILDFLTSEEVRHAAIVRSRYRALTGAQPELLQEDFDLVAWPDIQ